MKNTGPPFFNHEHVEIPFRNVEELHSVT